jgi:hypothetical protein
MLGKKGVVAFLAVVFLVSGVGFCQSVEDNWDDFLHYTTIGLLDLAVDYAQALIDSKPDPLEVLALSE